MNNLEVMSKSARYELAKQDAMRRRDKKPIEYLDEYEFKGIKLGDELVTEIKFERANKKSEPVTVKVIGFQLDSISSRCVAVTIDEDKMPECMKGLYYEKACRNRLVDVLLKGSENLPLMWVKLEDIK